MTSQGISAARKRIIIGDVRDLAQSLGDRMIKSHRAFRGLGGLMAYAYFGDKKSVIDTLYAYSGDKRGREGPLMGVVPNIARERALIGDLLDRRQTEPAPLRYRDTA